MVEHWQGLFLDFVYKGVVSVQKACFDELGGSSDKLVPQANIELILLLRAVELVSYERIPINSLVQVTFIRQDISFKISIMSFNSFLSHTGKTTTEQGEFLVF